MTRRDIKLKLNAHLDGVDGCGDELTFKVRGHRTTKGGTTEFYELTLCVCRYSVLHLQRALRDMHKRDRARLENEQRRIEREITELKNRPYRRHLVCLRWPVDKIPPDSTVHPLHWYARKKRAMSLQAFQQAGAR